MPLVVIFVAHKIELVSDAIKPAPMPPSVLTDCEAITVPVHYAAPLETIVSQHIQLINGGLALAHPPKTIR